MRYRELGRTGFKVSEISLGTVEIGMPYGIPENGKLTVPDEQAGAKLLNFALDHGINFLDTARAYGESEAFIGRALRHRRKDFYLASKVISRHGEVVTDQQIRDHTVASVHESLRQLETDCIDLMMVHCRAAEIVPDPAQFQTLVDLKQEGKIRSIGASVYGEEAALQTIAHGGFDCLQIASSLLDRRCESTVFDLAQKRAVGLVARSVLLKGALTDRYRFLSPALGELKSTIQRVESLAHREQISLPEMAYRYILSQDMPQSALVGTASIEELKQTMEFAVRGPLSENVLTELRSIPMPSPQDLNPGNWPAS